MKFFCEYCGNRIDAEVDRKCPNCGASYKKNKSFIKLEEEKRKQIQTDQENKEKVIKHVFGIFKFSGIISIIPIIVFAIVFITIIILGINMAIKTQKSFDKTESSLNQSGINEIVEEKTNQGTKQEAVTANFDEFAETKKYKVKVNKYEVIKDTFKTAEEGYELVKFHLLVENLTEYEIDSEDVNCVVDGVAQNNYYYSGHSDLPFNVSKGLTVKGTATFIVPKNATSYDIKYGDYVTIHIEK